MEIVRRGRFWAVHDPHGQLVCVTVYKKGAAEVIRRLSPTPTLIEGRNVDESFALIASARTQEESEHGTRHTPDDRHG